MVAEHGPEADAQRERQLGSLGVGPGALQRRGPAATQVHVLALHVHGDRGLGDALHGPGHHPQQVVAAHDAHVDGGGEPADEHGVVLGELLGVEVRHRHAEQVEGHQRLVQIHAGACRHLTGGQVRAPHEGQIADQCVGGSLGDGPGGALRVGTLRHQPVLQLLLLTCETVHRR